MATFAFLVSAAVACRQPPPAPPLTAQVSGTLEVAGLAAPVRIVRDRWGVPHISAQNQDDLFVAQGFVQAQDRLFQMDLWRRSVQGRLSQVLGPNFIERDAMTRRVQYRGDTHVEWASYGPDARAIAAAFVRGINAFVTLARDRPPEEFVLAGWKPEFWSPDDLLNRTDAFVSSGDAIADVRRAKLSDVIAEAIGRVGAAPFFAGLAAPVDDGRDALDVRGVRPFDGAQGRAEHVEGRLQRDQVRADAPYFSRSVSRVVASRDGALSLSESYRTLTGPAPRYFVHLKAPGWNVIGATAPWLPGVAFGHNERVAWGMAPIDADTQDIYVEENGAGAIGGTGRTGGMGRARLVSDAIVVKGRRAPFVFDTEISARGVVIAVDREHGRTFTLRWSGMEPGAAAELGALALDRAQSWTEFRTALARWKMPARRVVYRDVAGHAGFQDVALVPRKRGPEWTEWVGLDDLPHALNPRAPVAASAPAQRGTESSAAPTVFTHPLAITAAARRRFNVGPLERPPDDSPIQAVFDPRDWDRSRAMVAPGQAGSPASPHFSDLANVWTSGELVPLAFTDAAIAAQIKSTLTLLPKSVQGLRP